jgi:hypothetical protein
MIDLVFGRLGLFFRLGCWWFLYVFIMVEVTFISGFW